MTALSVPVYVALVAVVAFGATSWRRTGRGRPVAMLLALPILGLGCFEGAGTPEGVVDALTPGVLVAVMLAARGHRLVLVAASLLLAEELDWGQVFTGFSTPSWHAALPSRSTNFNFHNVRGLDWLWQPLPLVVLLAMTRRGPIVDRAEAWGLPRMAPALLWVLLALFTLAPGVYLVGGARAFDEAFELASVCAFYAGWDRVWPGRG